MSPPQAWTRAGTTIVPTLYTATGYSNTQYFSSKEVCNVLKLLTSMGLTVVSVIHQPRYEIFQMFDEVLLLGKGGKTVYL
jgi:hypothetical protein